ncbi:MAG: TonB-dependent receptor plug domain-containing protein, partial [Cyclobacteriaceae bacterium]|nr:TonB-dependent receptor plug domain-containing protein [Cyclobacteriaceae bacterium]
MKVVFVTLFFLLIGPARAQVDSVWLEAVEVEAFAFSTFATGAATRILDVGDSTASLAQQLAHVPSVFFKTYGNGQLSSISFRGTSASHTQVLWHGLPSNSPTLGQSDFSLWPVWLLDGLGVQAGSAGALYGSGSIGGTVFIDHFEKSREKPPAAVVHASAGSFGQWFGGVKTRYQRGRWSGGSRLFYSGLENDFPIRLPGTSRIIRQQNAQSLSYGAKQRIQYQGNRQRWSLDAIYVFNDRHIQPSYTSQAVSNTLQSENIRLAMEHVRDMRQGSVTSTVGYLSDQTNYNQGSITTSHQYSFLHRYEYTPAKHFHLQSGIQANQARAVSDHFTGQNTLSNLDVFQSLLWRVQGWSLSGTLRKSFSSRVASPLTFSAGFDHHWKWAEANNLNWTGQFSTGFRVPTLNDLYWVPGGNPLLRPE